MEGLLSLLDHLSVDHTEMQPSLPGETIKRHSGAQPAKASGTMFGDISPRTIPPRILMLLMVILVVR